MHLTQEGQHGHKIHLGIVEFVEPTEMVPGPLIKSQTPTFPVSLARAASGSAATYSCLARVNLTSLSSRLSAVTIASTE